METKNALGGWQKTLAKPNSNTANGLGSKKQPQVQKNTKWKQAKNT
jgi:hypothetical protein